MARTIHSPSSGIKCYLSRRFISMTPSSPPTSRFPTATIRPARGGGRETPHFFASRSGLSYRRTNPTTTTLMAHLFVAIFLIIFGLNLTFGLSIPIWVTGLLALIGGVLLLLERFSLHVNRK